MYKSQRYVTTGILKPMINFAKITHCNVQEVFEASLPVHPWLTHQR